MRLEQTRWTRQGGWGAREPGALGQDAQLVLAFAGAEALKDPGLLAGLRRRYPAASLLGCSTAGEIHGVEVRDDSLALTAVQLERSTVKTVRTRMTGPTDSFAAGARLASALAQAGLVHVLVLSCGVHNNGSALVKGLEGGLPAGVTVSGGLAGDGTRFQDSRVIWDGVAQSDIAIAIGLYGGDLRVGCGSLGGWDPFGPERLVTRSAGNVLYELDGRSALELYKNYLGDHARGLPASGLFYPLTLRGEEGRPGVVRTILGVDEDERSMRFAGDVPAGSYARLMKANSDRLIDGAAGAARACLDDAAPASPGLAVLISCVGRRMVLGQRVEEEVEAARGVLGAGTALTGFYSYGEIAPFALGARSELHNQTMTITTVTERAHA